MSDSLDFTDRYQALGMAYPDADTCCAGQCEGTGFVPIRENEQDAGWKALWDEAHAKPHTEPCDGTHFVKCPACEGTGKRTR